MKCKFLIPLSLIILSLASCRAAKKAQFLAVLNTATEQQKAEQEKIEKIDLKKTAKIEEGNIDDSISYLIDRRLMKYQRRVDSVNREVLNLKAKIEDKKAFRKEFKVIQAQILLLDSFTKNPQLREYVFYMIDDGLNKTKRTLFELAAFFGPGGYIIPDDKKELAKQYFSPVIDSLMKFSNEYSEIERIATIVLNGYADGTGIGEGSNLYNMLVERMGKTTATKEELNEALSELRAENLRTFLNGMIAERANSFVNYNTLTFENIKRGMGEQFPNPKITDYLVDDERRRIVLCYWSVLPND